MLYYFEKYKLAILEIPGINSGQKSLINYLINHYETNNKDIKVKIIKIDSYTHFKINSLSINLRVDKWITFIQNPLDRIFNISLMLAKHKDLTSKGITNLEKLVDYIYINKNNNKVIENENSVLNPFLYILSDETNIINYARIIKDTVYTEDLIYLGNIFGFGNNEIEKYLKDESIKLPDDYMVNYTDIMIRKIYEIYYVDYEYFKFPLHKIPVELINYPVKNNLPIFTIITPTLGNSSLLKLKDSLKYEKIPFIHLILWDKNRCKNALNPKDLEDDRTFCYEFTHPYHNFPNQRNDVWLRGVGVTLTNTPFITFFDDDTWADRNHLEDIYRYMINNKLEYTFCKRRMWEYDASYYNNNLIDKYNNLKLIGTDNFESIGERTKMGYRLIDNSSLYMRLNTARVISSVFLDNQYYGDDRETPKYLDKFKGGIYNKVLVNHTAKENLVGFFRSNILSI